jgi:hypothetical protein
MRNGSTDLFAHKTISIINPFVSNYLPKGAHLFSTDTAFCYPEGGLLVAGVESKLFIELKDREGRGISSEGKILNSSEQEVASFRTGGSGTTITSLMPQSSQNYFLSFDRLKVRLPKPQEKGAILQVKRADNSSVELAITGNIKDDLWCDILTSDGSFIVRKNVKCQKALRLNSEDLKGYKFLALLRNQKGEILSHRYFVNATNRINNDLVVTSGKKKFGLRDSVDIAIKGIQRLRNVTVSVAKSCLVSDQSINKDIAINDLLLKCEIPDYSQRRNNLAKLPELKGEFVTGKIINPETGEPIVKERFMLNFVGNVAEFQLAETDSLGQFCFETNRFGKEEMVIQPFSADTTKLNYKVLLDEVYCKRLSGKKMSSLYMDSIRAELINNAIVNMQVNTLYEAYQDDQKIQNKLPGVMSFYGHPPVKSVIERFIELPTTEEVVREVVPFAALRLSKGKYRFRVYEDNSMYPREGETLAFVDGVPIRNVQDILDIAPQDLERVEVVNLDYYLEDECLGRLLCFYTRNTDMADMAFDHRIFRQVHQGYLNTYRYAGPVYETKEQKESRLADYRNVLYFNTFDQLSSNNEINFRCYTSDEASVYTIVVKGIDEHGQEVEMRKQFSTKSL